MREAMARASSHIWPLSERTQASQSSCAEWLRMRARRAAGVGWRTSGPHSSVVPWIVAPSIGCCAARVAVGGTRVDGVGVTGSWLLSV